MIRLRARQSVLARPEASIVVMRDDMPTLCTKLADPALPSRNRSDARQVSAVDNLIDMLKEVR